MTQIKGSSFFLDKQVFIKECKLGYSQTENENGGQRGRGIIFEETKVVLTTS